MPNGKFMKFKIKIICTAIIIIIIGISLFHKIKYAPKVINPNVDIKVGSSKFELVETNMIAFLMDSVTSPSDVQYFEFFIDSKKNQYLTLLNSSRLKIYFYNLSTGLQTHSISLENYGFTMNDKVQGFHFINDDSLFVYGYNSYKLSLLNLKTGIIFSKTLVTDDNDNQYNIYPYISTRTPIIFDRKRNELYLTGVSSDEGGTYSNDQLRRILVNFNINGGIVQEYVRYPKFYWGKNWGGAGGFRQTFIEQNNKSEIALSFMADHYIRVFNQITKTVKRMYAGSKYIDTIESLPYSTNYFDFINSYDIYRYYLGTASYSVIKYDKYRNVYYRIAELPNPHPEITSFQGRYKNKSVIILDSAFNKVGETLLPNYILDINNSFISPEGFNIKEFDKIDSDTLKFHILKLKSR